MECPNCKAEVYGKFCRYCGSAVSQRPGDANPAGLCPACGANVRPAAKFCSKCAAPLASSARESAVRASETCLHCGSKLKPGARFCKSCGMPVPSAASGPNAAGARFEAPAAPASVDRAPISSFSSPAPLAASRIPPATLGQTDFYAYPEIESPPSTATRPAPNSFPDMESRSTYLEEPPATSAGFWGNNKAILLTGVALLGLTAGGLTYWFVLRKPAAKSAPNTPSVSQPASAAATDKPSASQSATAAPSKSAAEPQSTAQPKEASATEPKKAPSQDQGTVPTASVPAQSGGTPNATPSDLSGSWKGEYTNHDTNQVTKVTLQISKDSAELLTGTLTFDPGGTNSASCAITGVYNPQSKFMVLKIANCQGHPPAYLQGKIGFSSVELNASQVFGVDSVHNSLLNISRQ